MDINQKEIDDETVKERYDLNGRKSNPSNKGVKIIKDNKNTI